jgi:hypothetical protein
VCFKQFRFVFFAPLPPSLTHFLNPHRFIHRDLHDALSGHSSANVSEAVAYSEHSRTRCVAITIETRPDYCLKSHIASMLGYGCTRIEIGVQSIYEDVARDTNRGHTVAAVAGSFQLAKDSGYKVVTHMMPDLPNMPWERDLAGFRELFENPIFRPGECVFLLNIIFSFALPSPLPPLPAIRKYRAVCMSLFSCCAKNAHRRPQALPDPRDPWYGAL